MSVPRVPPTKEAPAFNCPHCEAFANQIWGEIIHNGTNIPGMRVSRCVHCRKAGIWDGDALVWPTSSPAPLPNADIPPGARIAYDEARDIVTRSPRGAAALLRLVIQMLCQHAGQPGENLNADIAALVKRGLQPHAQKALDVVRVIGNNAVHPGVIRLEDDQATAIALFRLVNLIAQQVITDPKEAEALYGTLPETARDAIEKRDKKNS